MQRQKEIAAKLNPPVNNRKRCRQDESLLVPSTSTGSEISEEATFHSRSLPTIEPNSCTRLKTIPLQSPSPSINLNKATTPVRHIVYHQSRRKPNEGLNVSESSETNESKKKY